jgi:hypothetical protein
VTNEITHIVIDLGVEQHVPGLRDRAQVQARRRMVVKGVTIDLRCCY